MFLGLYYYAYIDSNFIVIGTYGFPSVVDLPNYLYIGQTDDRSVIGKRWNASRQTFEEVVCSTDKVVSVKGQKGDKGDKGDRGPRGEVGPEGPRGPAGKDFDGNLPGGTLRVNGKQAIYDSGASTVFGASNQDTMLTGKAIYSRVAIAVPSDKRFRDNIEPADEVDAVEFVKNLPVYEYSCKGSQKRRIGVMAQDLISSEFGKHFVEHDYLQDKYAVSYSELVFPLYLAYQELEKRFRKLEQYIS